jgi:hypothetical protein
MDSETRETRRVLPAWAMLGATAILTLSGMAGIVAGQRGGTASVVLAGLLFAGERRCRAPRKP